jgi:hypothetical protein
MQHLPLYIGLLFAATTLATILFFYKAAHANKKILLIILPWMAIQTIISLTGFYTVTTGFPPRLFLLVGPPVILITFLFLNKGGRQFIDLLNIRALTLLHIIRIPVEIVLLLLSLQKFIPTLMTFEGRNFDILSGITAPLLFYFAFKAEQINRTILLAWNFICLGLLLNIVINAILSVPSPFQQFAFDQPNIAILYFPFILLPSVIVPLVLLAHLAAIRKFLRNKK